MVLAFLVKILVLKNPELEKQLRIAKINKTPDQFMRGVITLSFFIALTLSFVSFLFLAGFRSGGVLGKLFFIFLGTFFLAYLYFKRTPLVYIRKRQRDIDREVLFAGRYLVVKVESGVPLLNALEDAAKSYGVASKYFQEIVDEIKTGTPIEEALEDAREHSPSRYFKMILSELITSLRTGVDISGPLRSILEQITNEQMLEIKDYAKKLNAFMMIYMVVAAVLPSLGMTIAIIVFTFMGLGFDDMFAYTLLFLFAVTQFFFIAALKSMRPLVNL